MGSTKIQFAEINALGDEARFLFYDAIYEQLAANQYGNIFTIDKTIPWGGSRKMLIGGEMGAPLRLDTGCGGNITANVAIGQRTLNTRPTKGLVGLCLNDLERTIINAMPSRIDKNNEGTFIFEFVITRMQQAVLKQLTKNAFFGDTASGDATMNLTDGIFSVLLQQAANEGMPVVNTFGGVALGAGDGIELMTQVYEAQTDELYGTEGMMKQFLISRAVYQQMERDLTAGAINSGDYTRINVDGVMIPMFRGIPIIVMAEFDSDWDTLTGQTNGNLVLLTAKGNLVMGTDGSAPQSQYEQWYERKDEQNYVRTLMSFGFNYASEKLMVAAYKVPAV